MNTTVPAANRKPRSRNTNFIGNIPPWPGRRFRLADSPYAACSLAALAPDRYKTLSTCVSSPRFLFKLRPRHD
jgi:hypothetical protein